MSASESKPVSEARCETCDDFHPRYRWKPVCERCGSEVTVEPASPREAEQPGEARDRVECDGNGTIRIWNPGMDGTQEGYYSVRSCHGCRQCQARVGEAGKRDTGDAVPTWTLYRFLDVPPGTPLKWHVVSGQPPTLPPDKMEAIEVCPASEIARLRSELDEARAELGKEKLRHYGDLSEGNRLRKEVEAELEETKRTVEKYVRKFETASASATLLREALETVAWAYRKDHLPTVCLHKDYSERAWCPNCAALWALSQVEPASDLLNQTASGEGET